MIPGASGAPGPESASLAGWDVEVVRGSARDFHARDLPPPDRSVLWWFEVDAPALVLGTSQPAAHIDTEACERHGVDVVRRHSGGGAVLVEPATVAWFDVVIPRGHPRWVDDVGRAAWWVGEVVAGALGLSPEVVHRGAMLRSAWSAQVCFAGVGPGELVSGGRKVAGVSQRRTRDQARFQVAVYREWAPERLVRLLSPPAPTAGELAPLVGTADLTLPRLLESLGASAA